MDISLLSPEARQVPISPVMSYGSAAAVVGMSGALATGRNISHQNPGEVCVGVCVWVCVCGCDN